jgi:predicted metalloprotease
MGAPSKGCQVRWRSLERSGNVEDRRRAGPVAAGVGGLGLVGIIVALFAVLSGGSDTDLEGMLQELQAPAEPVQQTAPAPAEPDDEAMFVEAVLGSTETHWEQVFAAAGRTYVPANLVLFSRSTSSACGGATTAIGPHYCPRDQTIYVDLGFFEQLQTRFGARGGDFAEAYVIAHEVAHHVQNLLGIMEEVQQVQQDDASQANEFSVRLELQADCLAGTWGHSVFERDVLEPGDIEEGLDAAAAVGDDRIQQTMTGRVNPESWTHGSSEQRVEWFKTGYETGDPNACNTFG